MSCLDKLREALLGVTPHVYHFHAHKPPQRYIVWAEDGAGDTVFANGPCKTRPLPGQWTSSPMIRRTWRFLTACRMRWTGCARGSLIRSSMRMIPG